MSGAFTRRGALALAALGGASLAAAALLGIFGDVLYDPPSVSPDTFSRSAVGHRAFVELLRSLGFRVLVSRHRTAAKAGEGAVVVLLEPRVGPFDETREATMDDIAGAAERLLVVLPKRSALPSPQRPRWAAYSDLLPVQDAQQVLDALDIEGKVVRPGHSIGAWRGELPAPEVEKPQLVASSRLAPLVSTDDGILAGEIVEDEWHVVVVADPDVFATHALGRGDNAVLAVRLLERLGADELPVAVDETLHGFDQQPSLARELLRFPLVLATLSALVAAAFLAWAALVRFGRPLPPEPLLASGKGFLVESSAALLRHGGHVAQAAAAYLRAAKDEVVHRLRTLGDGATSDAWLADAAAARGRGEALAEIEERVARLPGRRVGVEEEAVRTAQQIHRWREEMTDGAHGDPRRDRAAQG